MSGAEGSVTSIMWQSTIGAAMLLTLGRLQHLGRYACHVFPYSSHLIQGA